MTFGTPAGAQLTLEIPESEFEEIENYKPIPVPDPSGGPVNQMFETMELDMTGTLPEAVLEEMLGETPYDFVDVVWGMEVTGDWTDSMTGEGTLQVTDFTEGRGATTRVDLERFTGLQGFHMYNARLQTDGDHVFTLSAAFPAEEGGVALGTEIDGVKSIFEVTWLCHMFEPDRRGCIDYPDEYYETDLPVLSKLHVQRRSGSYKIDFEARVHELRTHRDLGYTKTEISGRFADVRGWVCDRASWEDDPEDCTVPELLRVVTNSPPDGRENVHLETPEIEVKFNYPVDANDLEEHFSLTTRDIRGEHLEKTGRFLPLSDTHFRFDPDYDLESGVIYEARIEGGEDGLEGLEGEILTSGDHWWRFTTLVDLENYGHDGPVDEPVRTHVYQTVRDAPLVVDKPALQRIYVDWQPHDHINRAWQAETFPAELEINVLDQSQWRIDPQEGGSIDGDVVRVVRSDLLEQDGIRSEIERQARNTINVYGWAPDQQGGSSVVETRLAPHDPYPESAQVQDVIAERDVQHWHTDPAPLVFRYAFLKVGSWSDGVPEADMETAETMIRMAEEFAVQLMPVKEAYGIDTGRDIDLPFGIHLTNRLLDSISALRDELGGVSGANDILAVFYPTDFYAKGGAHKLSFDARGRHGVMMGVGTDFAPGVLAQGLVHEFGHYYGLPHRPGDNVAYQRFQFSEGDFDGFRLAIDGMSGHNKSSQEGNGEHPNTLVPLMWPDVLPRSEAFVSRSEYMALMLSFATRPP